MHRPNMLAAVGLGLLAAGFASPAPAVAQFSGERIKIGVLTDESGPFADIGGKGSVVAAQMAVEDFGPAIAGHPIEILDADMQNKPDIAVGIARRWFDVDGVDAIVDLPVSSVALAVQDLARTKGRTTIVDGAATSDLTGRACSPYSSHWADDTYALAIGTARAITRSGGSSWFFLVADYAYGYAMERDAAASVVANGGTVVGSVRHPLNTPDFSSYLLQAQASKAKIIGLASVGADTINEIKQANEFGLSAGGQRLAGFIVFITDIHSLGLQSAQGLLVLTSFYWDQNDVSRVWAKRFFDRIGRMPTKQQAAVYASVTHYLRSMKAAGTDDAARVNTEMRREPVDFFGRPGHIRDDGRVVFDVTLYQVKSPPESKGAWDYYKAVQTIAGADAFRPEGEGGCDLGKVAPAAPGRP